MFECARWKFWRSLDVEIVAICPMTAVVIEANAQYAVKPIFLIVDCNFFFSDLRLFISVNRQLSYRLVRNKALKLDQNPRRYVMLLPLTAWVLRYGLPHLTDR